MRAMPTDHFFDVLLVDDDAGNAVLLQQASEHSDVKVNLHLASNGEEGLAFLRKEGRYANAPTPDLVLLDINMPVMDGHEMLAALVADPHLKSLPVVVLTTSANECLVDRLYALRCNTYVVKPRDFEDLERVVDVIYQYWFTVAALPTRHR